MSDAAKNVSILLSREETKYCIDLISLATGRKVLKMPEALLSYIVKIFSTPVFCECTLDKQLVNDIIQRTLFGDES